MVMTPAPSFTDIEKEFEESLGYIRNDIAWLCGRNNRFASKSVKDKNLG
jgi:hypothetical protein